MGGKRHPESAVDQPQAEMEASPQKRWLCNEMVHELCRNIPVLNTPERILLTSFNMYVYLGPGFRKKRLIYRDAIAFLKAKLNIVNKHTEIWICGATRNNESEPIVVINQEESENNFVLETNHLTILIFNRNGSSAHKVTFDIVGPFECAHLQYFLRLIAPLLHPIQLDFYSSRKPIKHLMPFLNALSDCIDSIRLSGGRQFSSTAFNGALGKCNNLEICDRLNTLDVPKLVNWLTNHNNGQSKKYLNLWRPRTTGATLFLDKVKKDFARATSKCRFVVRLMTSASLNEFTLCNKLTGEKLQLNRIGVKDGRFVHRLSRSWNKELDGNGDNFAEFDPQNMTVVLLY